MSLPFCRTWWSSNGSDPAAGDLSEYQGHLEGKVVEEALTITWLQWLELCSIISYHPGLSPKALFSFLMHLLCIIWMGIADCVVNFSIVACFVNSRLPGRSCRTVWSGVTRSGTERMAQAVTASIASWRWRPLVTARSTHWTTLRNLPSTVWLSRPLTELAQGPPAQRSMLQHWKMVRIAIEHMHVK